jgi:hypothetical protein
MIYRQINVLHYSRQCNKIYNRCTVTPEPEELETQIIALEQQE